MSRPRGICDACETEAELVDGRCAACWAETRSVGASLEPILDELVATARAHPVGRALVEGIEDWAVGRRARKAREKEG